MKFPVELNESNSLPPLTSLIVKARTENNNILNDNDTHIWKVQKKNFLNGKVAGAENYPTEYDDDEFAQSISII